jgi:cAMP-dependent protein kinase regulator
VWIKQFVDDESVWREIRVLQEGESFGELALISNHPRAATVYARDDLHVAVLDKWHYVEILSKSSDSVEMIVGRKENGERIE